MYRKPTTAATITRNLSCHPVKYKSSSLNYLHHIQKTCALNQDEKMKEQFIIDQILQKHQYRMT